MSRCVWESVRRGECETNLLLHVHDHVLCAVEGSQLPCTVLSCRWGTVSWLNSCKLMCATKSYASSPHFRSSDL